MAEREELLKLCDAADNATNESGPCLLKRLTKEMLELLSPARGDVEYGCICKIDGGEFVELINDPQCPVHPPYTRRCGVCYQFAGAGEELKHLPNCSNTLGATLTPPSAEGETPRTDALLLEINEGRTYANNGPVADLARQLERELNAAAPVSTQRMVEADEILSMLAQLLEIITEGDYDKAIAFINDWAGDVGDVAYGAIVPASSERVVAALRFYADGENYKMRLGPKILEDKGKMAREALSQAPQNKQTAYRLLKDRFEHKAGTVVYPQRGYDYGLASDDTRSTGKEHTMVTLNPNGDYPGFTVPVEDLESIAGG